MAVYTVLFTPSSRAELNDRSAPQRRGPLQRFPKVLRYIKLNYFCHDNLLDLIPFRRPHSHTRSTSNRSTKSVRIDNARNRTTGACAKAPYRQRMISST